MNKLIVSLFLVVFVAVAESQPTKETDKYLPIVQKYCNGRFGIDGLAFLTCYREQVQKIPGVYNDETLIKACVGQSATHRAAKEKCDLVTGAPSVARDAFMQCLVDHINDKVKGSGLTFDQAIADGSKRTNACA